MGVQTSRYEFSVGSRVGPAIFHMSKVLTVLPRFVIANQGDCDLDFAQLGSLSAVRLPPEGARQPWHWPDSNVRFPGCNNAIFLCNIHKCCSNLQYASSATCTCRKYNLLVFVLDCLTQDPAGGLYVKVTTQ